ncbi:Cadherin domain-containing protein [Vibrio neonatus]
MLVTVTDDQGATTTQQVSVTVEGTNDKPVLSADTHMGSINEDGTLFARGQVLATDVDHNSKLTYTADSEHGTYGEFTLNADAGTWTYTLDNEHHQDLAAGETHTESMLVTVTDDKGAKVTETVQITITGTNDKPVITSHAQAETVNEDGVLFVNGQVTATDADHNAVLTYTPDNLQGTYGTFVLNSSSGKWHYTLDNDAHQALAEGESHTETMLVTVTDDQGATTTQQVSVTVEGTNDKPVITSHAQIETVNEDGILFVDGQVTATDVDHNAVLAYTPDSLQGTYGSFVLNPSSGKWHYTLDNDAHQALAEGESHTETMLVTVTDDKGATTTQQVSVTVEGTNDKPVLHDDTHTGSVNEDGTLFVRGQVLASDVDNNSKLIYTADSEQGTYGDFTLNADSGTWTYKLDNEHHQDLAAGETHTESMLVTVTDDKGAKVTETVQVTITGTNDKPVITSQVQAETVNEDGVLFVDGQVTATDADHNAVLTYTPDSLQGTYGSFVLNPSSGKWHYTLDNDAHQALAEGESHVETMLVTVTDDQGATTTQQVRVTVEGTNDKPVLSADTHIGSVNEDGTLLVRGQVLATDVDNNAKLTYTADSEHGTYGDFTLNADSGTWTYKLDNQGHQDLAAGETHTESMLVTVTDDKGAKVTETVEITITGTNDKPVLHADTHIGSVNEDGTLFVRGQVLATDVDHNSKLTYTADSEHGAYGDFTLNADSGTWTYQLDNQGHQDLAAGETQTESMLVTVTDDKGAKVTETVEITITGTNDRPVITSQAQAEAVKEDGVAFVEGQVTATDVDHNAVLTYTPDNLQGTYGTFVLNPSSGKWNYTLDNDAHQALAEGESHVETMLVTVTDDQGATTTQQVRVTVEGTNDVPELQADTHTGSVNEDGTLLVRGQVLASDVDHNSKLTYTAGSQHGIYGDFTLNADSGTWTYKLDNKHHQDLAAGETQTESMLVTVTDDKGAKVTETVEITITGTNDKPVITSQAQAEAVKEDGVTFVEGQVTTTDVDHNALLTYSPDNLQGTYGTFVLNPSSGEWNYQLDNKAHQALAEGESHVETMLVTVTDDHGATTTQQVRVTVEGTNDVPVLHADTHTGSVEEDGTLSTNGQVIATDVDNHAKLTFSANELHGTYGEFTLDADSGEWTYKLANDQHQDLSEGETHKELMSVTVTDDKGAKVVETVEVVVTGTNDLPVLTFTDQASDHTQGTLSFTDVDTLDTHSYAVSGGTDSGDTQTIVGQFGDLVLDTKTGEYTYTQHQSVAGMSIDANGVYHGKEFFEVSTSDNHGGTSTKYLTFEPSVAVNAPSTDGQPPILTPELTQSPELLDQQPVIAPIVPPTNQLNPLTIDPSSDTGASQTDGITSVVTPSVTGHTDIPFSVVTLTDENGNVVALTTSNEHGDFTVALAQLSGSVSGDVHQISGTAVAPSATVSVSTPTPLQLTIDTDINQPTVDITDGKTQTALHPNHIISGTELSHVDISGVIDHQGVETDLTGLTVTDTQGNVAPLDPSQATVDPATGVFTLNNVDLSKFGLVDGTLTVHAIATDLAGNTKEGTFTATLDTQPGTIAIDGTLGGDNVINAVETQSPLTVSGTTTGIEEGQVVAIKFNGQSYSAVVGKDGTWSTDIPVSDLGKLTDGTTPVITASVDDKAGNVATPTTHDMQVDTHIDTTTVALNDGGVGANFDGVINAAEQTHAVITGTIDPTATLTLLTISDGTDTIPVPLASVLVSQDGHFTATGVDVSSLSDGQLTVTATAVDPAGNESSNTGSALLDTAPPNAPQLTPIPVGHDKTPPLSGTGEPGSTVTFIDGHGNIIGSTVVGSTGSFTYTPSTDLPDGGTISATLTDIHGNTSASTTIQTNIDTHIAPTTADITDGTVGSTQHPNHQISADELHSVLITGSIDRTDGTEKLTSLTVTDSAGTQVNLDIKLATFDSSTGKFSIKGLDLSGNHFVSGALTVEATAQDSAGNISLGHGTATLDIESGELFFDNVLSGDNIVNAKESQSPLTISGTTTDIEAGQIVDVTIAGTTYHATVDASGHWAAIMPQTDVAKLPDGDVIMQATVHDLAGNSTDITSNQLSVDTKVKAPTAITFESTGQDNLYNIDELGPDHTVTATIGLPDDVKAGDILTINGTAHTLTDQDIAHNYVTSEVYPNTKVTASITDQAGNTSQDISNTAADADLTPPLVPVLSPIPNADHNNDNTPPITGITEPGAVVEIFIDGTSVGTVNANPSGSFTYTPPALPDGPHSFTAKATDHAGNPSTLSAAVHTTIDTTPPAQLDVSLTTDTGKSDSDLITQTGTLHIENQEAGSHILYSIDHGTTWSSSFTPVEGDNTVTVKQVDQAGNESPTTSLTFTLDTQPGTIAIDGTLGGDNVINAVETQSPLTVSGTTTGIEEGQVVTIKFNGQSYSAIVGKDGTWSTDIPVSDLAKLTNGTTPVITASVDDKAGNVATPATHDMQVDTHIDTTTVALNDGGVGANFDGVINAAEQTHAVITGTIDPTAKLTLLTISDGTDTIPVPLASVLVSQDGHFTATGVDVSSLSDGTLTVTATAVDLAGNESSNTGSALLDTAPPNAPQLTPIPVGHDKTPPLSGTGEPGSTVTFIDGHGNTIGSIVVGKTGSFTYTPSTDLPDGGTISATLTDIHGNTSTSTTIQTNIDTHIAPTTADITDGTVGSTQHPNHQISADELHSVLITGSIDRTDGTEKLTTLTVTDSAGTQVNLDIKLATFDSSTGKFSIKGLDLSGNHFVSGELTVEATAQDSAGNISLGHGTATLDIESGELFFDNLLSGDNIVNAKESQSPLTISGTTTDIEAGQIVDVTIAGTTYHATVDASGHWAAVMPQTDVAKLPDGDVIMQATVHDLAGNSTDITSNQLSVDTKVKAPTAITFESTGQDNLYNIDELGPDHTVTATIGLPDDVKAGDILTINGSAHTLTDQDIAQNYVTSEVSPNTKVTASITDQAGNTSQDISNTAADADLAPPLVPVLSPIPNADHNNDNTPPITGITEPGAVVDIFIDNTLVGTVNANPSGSFTYTPPALPVGPHSFTAKATDHAGNPSTLSAAVHTTIDTTPPAQLDVSLTTDTGKSDSDLITQTGTLHIENQEAGSHILYSIDHGTTWSSSFTPVEGDNTVTVKQVDQAGNESPTSSLAFTLDTKVAAPQVKLKLDSGSSAIDHITNTAELDVTDVESGAHVEYSVDGGQHWLDSVGHQIDGDYTVLVRQTDVAGNVSGSATISYTLDTQTHVDVAIADISTGAVHGNHFLNDYEIVHNENEITGKIELSGDLTKLVISDGNHEVTVDLSKVNLHNHGTYSSFDISHTDLSSLDDGTLTVTATSKDTAGNTDTQSSTIFKDTLNEATDVTASVKEESKTSVSGHVNMEPDAHGGSSYAFGSSSLSGDIDGTYGTLHLNRDGTYTYDLHNANPKVQALGEGATLQDIVTYKTTDPAGNEKESHLTVTITGTNDQAIIAGVDSGDVIEDKVSATEHSLLKTDGQLTIDDIDTNTLTAGGEEQFVSKVTPAANAHNLGSLSIDKDGHWHYQVRNDNQHVQALQEQDTHVDQFIVHSIDGTAHTISVTITGTKDAPSIEVKAGADHGAVVEQGSTSSGHAIAGQQTATGHLVAHDVDTADTQAWTIVGSSDGSYGHISVDANGEWTYTLDNARAATQGLTQDQHVTESFTVRVTDSTGLTADQKVVIKVTGSNDQAQIAGTDARSVKEDTNVVGSKHQLHTDGQLTISDVDSGEAHFQASTMVAGQDGHLGSLSIDETGHWDYVVDNSLHAVQQLKESDHIDDVFTVLGADGTEHTITVTINGTNDLPEIAKGTGDTGAVTEAGSHANNYHNKVVDHGHSSTSGTLSATDRDAGDPAHWQAAHPDGTYGHLSLNAQTGHWVYTLDNAKADSLHAKETVTETFAITDTDTDSSKNPVSTEIVITITGSNDVPVITGSHVGAVTEAGGTSNARAGVASIDGTLIATDPDNNDATLVWSVQSATSGTTVKEGTYGSISIDQHGHWVYTIDDSKDATQALTGRQSPKEHFTFLVTDSSGKAIKQSVEITVHGRNDNPVLSAYTPTTFAEDSTPVHGHSHIQTVALPKVTDVDDSAFTYSIDSHPDHGNHNHQWITIDSHTGVISVHTDAKDLQHLSVGASHTEDVVVTVKDAQGGTTQQTLHLTIAGTNDAPTITEIDVTSLKHRVDDISADTGKSTGTSTDQVEHSSALIKTHTNLQDVLNVQEDRIVEGDIKFKDIDDHKDASHSHGDTYTFSATATVDGKAVSIKDSGFSIDNDGHFVFDAHSELYQMLQAGQDADVRIQVTVEDNHQAQGVQEVHFVVHGENDAPTATRVTPINIDEDHTLQFTLGHDDTNWGESLTTLIDPESDKLDISNPSVDPKYGTIVDHGMGRFTFTPVANQNVETYGLVPVTFEVDDNHYAKATRTAYIHVNPVNDAPTAGVVTLAGIDEDSGSIHFTRADLLAHTNDIDNTKAELALSDVVLSDAKAGTLSGDEQHGWTFTPSQNWNSNWNKNDFNHDIQVVFKVTDPQGLSSAGGSTLPVNPTPDAAVITEDSSKQQDHAVHDGEGSHADIHAQGYLHIEDPDLGQDSFQVSSSIGGQHGFLSIDANGHWQYTLNTKDPVVLALGDGESTTDTITVHAQDGTAHDITISITGKNEAPVVTQTSDIHAKEFNADATHTVSVISGQVHVTDSDSTDTLSYQLEQPIAGFHLDQKTGKYTFDSSVQEYNHLSEGEVVNLQAVVLISDGHGGTVKDTVAIELTGTNDEPHAVATSLPSVQAGETLHFTDASLLAGVMDPDSGDDVHILKLSATHGQHTLTEVHLTDKTLGHLTQDGKGGYDFTPNKGISGDVEVQYSVTDGIAVVDGLTTIIHVTPAPASTPTGGDQHSTHTGNQNPDNSHPQPITVTPADTHATIDESGTSVSGQLHETHSDTGSQHHNAHAYGLNHATGSYGYITMTSDGKWTYTLDPHTSDSDVVNQLNENEQLVDSIEVNGPHGKTTISVTIKGSNDKPVITGTTQHIFDSKSGHENLGSKAAAEVDMTEVHGLITATDVDHNAKLTYSLPSDSAQNIDARYLENGHLAGLHVNPDGSYEFKPDSAHFGDIPPGTIKKFKVSVEVTDEHGATAHQVISLAVQGHNRPPEVAHTDLHLANAKEDFGTLTLTTDQLLKQAGATDPDGDTLHIINFKVTDNQGKAVSIHDDGHGNFVFTSAQDLNGQVHLSFEVTDGMSAAQQITASMDITPVNDKPVASSFALTSVAESTTSNPTPTHVFTKQDFLAHASDVDITTNHDALQFVGEPELDSASKAHGRLIKVNGGYEFKPSDPNWYGSVSVHYTVKDLAGEEATATATITVTPTNDAAEIKNPNPGHAVEDQAHNAQVTGQLTISDVDGPSEEVFHANSHIGGRFGYLQLDDKGEWKYVLTRGSRRGVQQLGDGDKFTERFAVTSQDGTAYEVRVNILGTNDDAVITGTDTGTMNTEVTPSVTEQLGSSATATATPDEITTTGTLTVQDVDKGEAGFKAETLNPTNTGHHYGTLTIQQSGAWTYVVDNNNRDVQALHEGEQIQEHFTATSIDGTATQDITVTLVGKNNAPVIAHVTSKPAIEAGAKLTGQLHSSDIDNDHATVTYSLQQGTSAPDGFVLQANGHYSFDPTNKAYNALSAGETTTVVAHVVATDSHNGVSEAKDIEFVITGTNDAATFSGSSTVHVQDSPSLHNNAASAHRQLHVTDVDHGESHFIAENSILPDRSHPSQSGLPTSAYGHLSITDNGQWQYHVDHADRVKAIPNGQHVTETFTVHSTDGTPHTVTVTLDGRNEAATFKGDFSGEVTDGQSASVTGTVQVADVDYGQAGLTKAQSHLAPSKTDIQHHTGLSTDAYGHLSVDSHGHWAYHIDDTAAFNSIADGQKVIETFAIAAKDGTHHNIVITLMGSNDAPTVSGAVAMQQRGTEDRTITLNQSQLLSHAVDVDNADHLTVVNVQAQHGTIKVDQHGKILYTPNANYHGSETFTYDVQDSQGATVHTQASMQVNSVNDAPTVAHSVTLTGINEDTHSSIDASALLAGASDVDRDRLSILANSVTAEHGQIRYDSHSHTYLYYPDHNFNGQDTLHYKVSDGHGGQVVQTATIDVASVNDAPTVTAPVSLPDHAEDSTVTITSAQLLTHAQDDDGDSLSISDLKVNHGKLVHHHNGTWSYTPDHNYNGKVILNYQVNDGHGGHVQQQALMTVTPENDAAHIDAPAVMYVDNGHNSFIIDTLSISDVDGRAEEKFIAETGLQGQFGELEISEDGQFKYVLNSHLPVIQQMMDGDTKTDTVTVHSVDGTAYDVQIHIGGHTNHAPTVSQHTPIVLQTNEHHQFSTADFLFSDTDGDSLDHITITQLPTHGELTLEGHHVQVDQSISADDIDKLSFTADSHDSGPVTFDFTANDGRSDSAEVSMTISVAQPTSQSLTPHSTSHIAASSTASLTGASDEPVLDTPVETVSLEALASNDESSHVGGAQAYLDQLGVNDDSASEQSVAAHQPAADLDLVLTEASLPVLDEHGHVIEPVSTDAADSLSDDEHILHDELHHQDPNYQWDDHHG